MNIFHKIKRFFNLSLDDDKAWNPSLWNLRGSITAAGETVTEETALNYSAVWNAVTLISGTIGSLPLHLMQKQGDKKRLMDDIPLYRLLHDQPNPYMTAMQFRETCMAHILTWGNSYSEKVIDLVGNVIELWPISPNRMLKMEMHDDKLWYEIKLDKGTKWMSRDQILHIPGLGFDGFQGYSVITMARNSIGLGMAMETFGSHYFGQGTHPGIVVSHPMKLNADAHRNLKNSLTESWSGLGQSHRLMLLEDGMKIEKLGIPPNDSQFLESRQFQIPEIARWFNIPPHKLKDLTKSSFNNIEQEQISFVTDTILPWLVRCEQNYNIQLLSFQQHTKEKLYFKHIVEGILRANSKERGEFYRAGIGSGWITPNEVRELEDLNPSDDPMADELWMPTGLIPLSKFDEYLAKNTGNQSNPDQTDEPKQIPPPEEKPEQRTVKPMKLVVKGDPQ